MKLNWKLWPLAFAAAAFVGCTEDVLDENPNGNGNGIDGPTTYMKVTVNQGTSTRAAGGEGGDGYEPGSADEYMVNNVVVVLYKLPEASGGAVDKKLKSDSELVAAGYADTPGMSGSSETHHSYMTTVSLTVKDGATSFDGKEFGVIAITNLTNPSSFAGNVGTDNLDTGADLANYLQVKSQENGFVMSSHMPEGETVTLRANATPDDAPQASVHVERLAAKVRINQAEDVTNFVYNLKGSDASSADAKVRLDQVAIVNQLTTGSYLLKRVSETISSGDLPAEATNDVYLGDEAWNSGTNANFVIDPWTRNKTNVSSITTITAATDLNNNFSQAESTNLAYTNAFKGSSYAGMWTSFSANITDLAAATEKLPDQIHLCYTLENTTNVANQKNGFSTGALFKATYFPKKWMVADNDTHSVTAQPIDYNGSNTDGEGFDAIVNDTKLPENLKGFYVYNGDIYKGYEDIFNFVVWGLQGESVTYSYSSFGESSMNITKEDFYNSKLFGAYDPFGYLKWLSKKITGNDDIVDDGELTGSFTAATDNFAAYLSEEGVQEKVNGVINFYEDFVCYYPYWIRHADNSAPTVMGIMEFGIVRNNIYDLKVTKINTLGLSSIDVPDPNEDDESSDLYFTVELYVKDWVVRNNGNIEL